MLEYFILFSILGVCAALSWFHESTVLFYFCVALMLIMPAIRDSTIGSDTFNYVQYFLEPWRGYGDDSREFEKLYIAWNDLIRNIWRNEHFFLGCTAVLNTLGFFFLIKKHSPYKVYSLLLFATVGGWIGSFALLRQYSAISLFLFSLYFFREKKRLIAATLFLVAFFFHATVLLFLPIVLLMTKVDLSKRTIYISLIVSFLIGVSGFINIEVVIRDWFSYVAGFDMIGRYSSGDSSEVYREYGNLYLLIKALLPMTALGIICGYYTTKEQLEDIYIKLFFVTIPMFNLFVTYILGNRVFNYTMALVIIAVPMILKRTKSAKYTYLVFGLFFLYQRYTYFQDMSVLNPYKSLLSIIF